MQDMQVSGYAGAGYTGAGCSGDCCHDVTGRILEISNKTTFYAGLSLCDVEMLNDKCECYWEEQILETLKNKDVLQIYGL